jgi:hypothetical protein
MSELAPLLAPYSLRDLLQRILPTVIASCLFIPFSPPLNKMVSFEGLIIGAILLSYLIESPISQESLISQIVSTIYDKLPKYKSLLGKKRWLSNNWNYDELFYSLSNEEREYLYLAASYIHFYKTVSFYLLIFAIVNLGLIIENSYPFYSLDDLWCKLQAVKTPILGQNELPSLPLFLISLILCYYTFKDFTLEFEVLFLENGAYQVMAKRYHLVNGGIATGIWGTVLQQGMIAKDVDVVLEKKETNNYYSEVCRVKTDDQGRFQFIEKFAKSIATEHRLNVKLSSSVQKLISIPQDEKILPEFRIE